jgi:hypothetical protein
MIDFERFWVEGNLPSGYEDEIEDDAEVPPGVGAEEFVAWQREHGVTMPEPIRTALGLRNGGFVRNASIAILPLDQIVPVDDDFWRLTELVEDEAPDHGLMFVFGSEIQSGATFLMNFNAHGPEGPPSVYIDHHGESTYLVNDTIGGYFEAELASDAEPSVDWSEAEGRLSIIASETIDLSDEDEDVPASLEQILAREGESLILFTRRRSPEGESLTRTTLPLPLDAGLAEIQPHPAASMLHLQPETSEGIVEACSERNDDGRWKNSTSRGVPVYVTFESTDRDRLLALRTRLLGVEGAARARAKEDRQAALTETLGTLTPDQRTAAMMQAALKLKEENERKFAAEFGDPDTMPPELADAAAAIRRRFEAMADLVRQRIAANPPDPETLRQIEGYLRDPDPGRE